MPKTEVGVPHPWRNHSPPGLSAARPAVTRTPCDELRSVLPTPRPARVVSRQAVIGC